MKTVAAVFAWLELVGLGLWIGGMLTIGAIAAPTVFGKLGSEIGGDVMSIVFRKFNGGFVYLCIVLAGLGFVGKFLLARRTGKARWIEGGLLLAMIVIGLYIGAILGPRMQEDRAIKIKDPSNEAAIRDFTGGHRLSRNLFSVNLVLGIVVLFFNAREMTAKGGS